MALYARRPSRAPAAQSHIEMPKRDITRALRIWGDFWGVFWEEILCGGPHLLAIRGCSSWRGLEPLFLGYPRLRIRYS